MYTNFWKVSNCLVEFYQYFDSMAFFFFLDNVKCSHIFKDILVPLYFYTPKLRTSIIIQSNWVGIMKIDCFFGGWGVWCYYFAEWNKSYFWYQIATYVLFMMGSRIFVFLFNINYWFEKFLDVQFKWHKCKF